MQEEERPEAKTKTELSTEETRKRKRGPEEAGAKQKGGKSKRFCFKDCLFCLEGQVAIQGLHCRKRFQQANLTLPRNNLEERIAPIL